MFVSDVFPLFRIKLERTPCFYRIRFTNASVLAEDMFCCKPMRYLLVNKHKNTTARLGHFKTLFTCLHTFRILEYMIK